MCNEYAREIEMARVIRNMEEMKDVPPFEYEAGRIPNDLAPQRSIKIRDSGPIARLRGNRLIADTMTWAWKTPGGKPVFNFVSERRSFSDSDRALILATGFYEYTTPKDAKVKLSFRAGDGRMVLDRRHCQAGLRHVTADPGHRAADEAWRRAADCGEVITAPNSPTGDAPRSGGLRARYQVGSAAEQGRKLRRPTC